MDRSSVTTMRSGTSDDTIVRSIIELGHDLGLSAVAEDAEVLAALAGHSCDVVQGYHVSRPLPAAAFERRRAAWPGSPAHAAIAGSRAGPRTREVTGPLPADVV